VDSFDYLGAEPGQIGRGSTPMPEFFSVAGSDIDHFDGYIWLLR
jgi:hypothetical protein